MIFNLHLCIQSIHVMGYMIHTQYTYIKDDTNALVKNQGDKKSILFMMKKEQNQKPGIDLVNTFIKKLFIYLIKNLVKGITNYMNINIHV